MDDDLIESFEASCPEHGTQIVATDPSNERRELLRRQCCQQVVRRDYGFKNLAIAACGQPLDINVTRFKP